MPDSQDRCRHQAQWHFERNRDVSPSRSSEAYNPIVSRPVAPVVLAMIALAPWSLPASESSPKIETVTGQVVAYSNDLVCLNGSGYWSMLIRVQNHSARSEFIQVRFSLPCNESPEWLNRKPPVQKFRLRREQSADSVLKEFLECAPASSQPCPHLQMWKRVPSAEKETLPFGKVVPNYRSADLPLRPVV